MKEALLKKRCGIPAALLLVVLLLASTALAWYCFKTIDSGTTVQEPLSVTETKEFSTTMYPGETNTWSFEVTNSAIDVSYTVKADLTYSAPDGVSVTSFVVKNPVTGDSSDETNDLKDDNSATFDIPASTTLSCTMTISADKDAHTGEVFATLTLSRGE